MFADHARRTKNITPDWIITHSSQVRENWSINDDENKLYD